MCCWRWALGDFVCHRTPNTRCYIDRLPSLPPPPPPAPISLSGCVTRATSAHVLTLRHLWTRTRDQDTALQRMGYILDKEKTYSFWGQ